MGAELDLDDVAATSEAAKAELVCLRERLYRAEMAVINATMGVMDPVAQYMRDYPEPFQL